MGNHCVASYRTPRPSSYFLDQLEKELSSQQLRTPATVATTEGRRMGTATGKEEDGDRDQEREPGDEGAESDKLSKQEARRLRREKRKKEVSMSVCGISCQLELNGCGSGQN